MRCKRKKKTHALQMRATRGLAKAYGPQIDSKPFEFTNLITGFAELNTETVDTAPSTSENDLITMELKRYTTTGVLRGNTSKVHEQIPKDTIIVRQNEAEVHALNKKNRRRRYTESKKRE